MDLSGRGNFDRRGSRIPGKHSTNNFSQCAASESELADKISNENDLMNFV